jgi:hypothetical protein
MDIVIRLELTPPGLQQRVEIVDLHAVFSHYLQGCFLVLIFVIWF